MNFTFSEEQLMSAQAARAVLDDTCTSAQLRSLLARDEPRDASRWQALAESGLCSVLAPESAGGMELGAGDFVLIAEACGYAALPEPLVEHAGVAVPLLAAAAPQLPLLEELVSGTSTLAIGHPVNPFVADADAADALLLAFEGEVHLLQTASARLTRQASIDPFRRLFRVEWSPCDATRIADAASGVALWEDALDRGALFSAAQCLGIAQRCVDLASAYAKERKQFGKPIGSYQAVKHALATVQVKIEFAKPVVHAGAAQFERRDLQSRARISHAKIVAAEAADLAARTAVQVHGAMGCSWEVDVHFFLKRALALNFAWGDPFFHRRRVAARVHGAALGPDQTFGDQHNHA